MSSNSRCICCTIRLADKSSHQILKDIDKNIINELTQWINPTPVKNDDVLCNDCFICIYEALKQHNRKPKFGFKLICYMCGHYITKSKSLHVSKYCIERTVINSELPQHLIPRLKRVCHSCWSAIQLKIPLYDNQKNFSKDAEKDVPELPDREFSDYEKQVTIRLYDHLMKTLKDTQKDSEILKIVSSIMAVSKKSLEFLNNKNTDKKSNNNGRKPKSNQLITIVRHRRKGTYDNRKRKKAMENPEVISNTATSTTLNNLKIVEIKEVTHEVDLGVDIKIEDSESDTDVIILDDDVTETFESSNTNESELQMEETIESESQMVETIESETQMVETIEIEPQMVEPIESYTQMTETIESKSKMKIAFDNAQIMCGVIELDDLKDDEVIAYAESRPKNGPDLVQPKSIDDYDNIIKVSHIIRLPTSAENTEPCGAKIVHN